jgi:hypothetical protein
MGGERQGLNKNRENNPMQSRTAPARGTRAALRPGTKKYHIITVLT